MAAATLVLNVPKLVTTSSDASKLREVILPIGTISLKISTAAALYLQVSGTDEGSETAAAQFKYPAGVFMEPMWFVGEPFQEHLRAALSIYFIGAGTAQSVWLHAVSR